jgi:RNA polymerase sigma-70 factor (ECF subfamily)
LRVLQRRRLLRSSDDLGYLLRTLRNLYLDQRRNARRRPQVEPLDEGLSLTEDGASALEATEARAVFVAIAALPSDRRYALVAVDVLGLSYREAAHALHTRESTITSRLYRARMEVASRLRRELLEPEVVRESAPLERNRVAPTPARKLEKRAVTNFIAREHTGVPAAQPGHGRVPAELEPVEH